MSIRRNGATFVTPEHMAGSPRTERRQCGPTGIEQCRRAVDRFGDPASSRRGGTSRPPARPSHRIVIPACSRHGRADRGALAHCALRDLANRGTDLSEPGAMREHHLRNAQAPGRGLLAALRSLVCRRTRCGIVRAVHEQGPCLLRAASGAERRLCRSRRPRSVLPGTSCGFGRRFCNDTGGHASLSCGRNGRPPRQWSNCRAPPSTRLEPCHSAREFEDRVMNFHMPGPLRQCRGARSPADRALLWHAWAPLPGKPRVPSANPRHCLVPCLAQAGRGSRPRSGRRPACR